MSLHSGGRFLPNFAEGSVTGSLERRVEIDSCPRRPPTLVAGQAIGLDERRYAATKELFGVGLLRFMISGHRAARPGQAQEKAEAQRDWRLRSTTGRNRSGHAKGHAGWSLTRGLELQTERGRPLRPIKNAGCVGGTGMTPWQGRDGRFNKVNVPWTIQ